MAKRGGQGKGSKKTGWDSDNVEILVPVGTVIHDADTGNIIADVTYDGQSCIVAKGGMGGKGNAWFATATNQAPRYAQDGLKGEERWLRLELKLLADVGIIGLPNVGKSTFLSKVSAARPKIADYPFTTLAPHLGVVKYGTLETFVIADMPGLIRGAHEGKGMGIHFLRHIERTTVLLHILDISCESYVSPWNDYETINHELACFNPKLTEKPQVVAINKIDLPVTGQRIKKAIDIFAKKGIKVLNFSAITGEGIQAVIYEIAQRLNTKKQNHSS